MDQIDRVADRNLAIQSESLASSVCQESVNNKTEQFVVGEAKEENPDFPTARLIVLKPDAIIQVHLDKNGVAKEDILEEWPCALNHAYFLNKNLRLHSVALELKSGPSFVLEFQVCLTSPTLNGRENMYVELFRGTEDCEMLKVTDTIDCSNIDSGKWTVTCEGVSMEVSQKVRHISSEL